MNTFNVIIHGNLDDIRGDSVVYFLERVPSGSCNIWVSGTTGSLSGNPIINHVDGDFTASISQMNWSDQENSNGNQFFVDVYNSTNPSFDIVIYPSLEANWYNWIGTNSASQNLINSGIPIFISHYNDTQTNLNSGSFYGFHPCITIGWGNYLSGNSGSYGNQLEFFDTVIDGANLSQSILLYGDNKGLTTTEQSLYLNNYNLSVNSLYAPVSLAAKYVNLVQALSSSYDPTSINTQIYYNYDVNNRAKFIFDARQYLRQVSTYSSSGWTPTQGFGLAQIQNYTGSNFTMPNLTSSYDLSTLGAGTPLYINVTSQSAQGPYTFTWVNYNQSYYKNTIIKANGRTIYSGTDASFKWYPDMNSNSVAITFYTQLINGKLSTPESNSIINLGATKKIVGNFERLKYGYACANDGTYIAVSSVNNDQYVALNGIVDVFQYDKIYNTYSNKFLIKKLVSPIKFTVLLATEDNTEYDGDGLAGKLFLDTEYSSSYDVLTPQVLSTTDTDVNYPSSNIDTEKPNLNDLIVGSEYAPFTNDPMDLEVESVFNLVEAYSDNFGKSLSLYNNLLAVGCPNFTITFVNGDLYTGGSVDIFDLNSWQSGVPYYPVASLTSDGELTFGESVSFSQAPTSSGSLYLAVGSSGAYEGYGAVYIYKRQNNDNTSWTLIQTLYGSAKNSYFGGAVKFDQSGNNYTLVVGNSNTTNNNTNVYVYEMNNDVWTLNTTFSPNHNIPQTLPYLNNLSPIIVSDNTNPNTNDGFGNSVSIYGNDLIIGSPNDTYYSEFVDGDIKIRGAVYFYRRCTPTNWRFVNKSWGNVETLVNNNLGYNVDIYNGYAVATVFKPYTKFTADYINNTLTKRFDCNPIDIYNNVLGQVLIYDYNISSSNWDILFTQQKVKDYNYPYLNYGFSTALYNQSFVVGAPCLVSDYTNFGINFSSSIQGYAYIYNLNNLQTNHPVGNVFYNDGKIILSNSGSIFNSLMKDKVDSTNPLYDLKYKTSLSLYEKQIVCTINPNEFNTSTNPTSMVNNSFFGFENLDRLLKYASKVVYNDYYWWNYITFNVVEQSLFNMYTENYDIVNTKIDSYYNELSSSYFGWDVDGNDKINFRDMTLIWKYFTNTLTQDDVFKLIEPKSARKTLTDIQYYIQNNVIVRKYGQINPMFFDYAYSSSIDTTGSYLAPYITTVGLYSGADLVAVAKLAQPIKNGGEFPLNILIKWDL